MAISLQVVAANAIDETNDNQADDISTDTGFAGDIKDDIDIDAFPTDAFITTLTLGLLGSAIEFAGNDGDDIVVNGGTADELGFTLTNTDTDGWLASGLYTLDGNQIFLMTDPEDDNILLAYEGIGNSPPDIAADDPDLVFAVYLKENKDTNGGVIGGSFWTVLFEPLFHLDGTSADDYLTLTNDVRVAATSTLDFPFAGAPSGSNVFMAFGSTDEALLVTGTDIDKTVNSGKGGGETTLGTGSQNVAARDGLYFTFVEGMNQDYLVPDLKSPEASDPANMDFSGVFGADKISVQFVKVSTGPGSTFSVKMTAMTTAPEPATPGDADAFFDGLGLANGDVGVGITAVFVNGSAVSFTTDGDGVVVSGLSEGDVVTYQTSGNHNRVLIENWEPLGSNIQFSIANFYIVDNQTAEVPVGEELFFYDDGPTVDVVADGTEPGAVYLFDGNTSAQGNVEGDNGTILPGDDAPADQNPTSVDVEYDGAFSVFISPGTDGGSASTQYSLVLGVAVGSQVTFGGTPATSGTVNVVWSEITAGSVYAGVADGSEVFRLSVDGDGTMTFEVSGVLDHHVDNSGPFSTDILTLDDDQISVRKTVTVTDGDTDTKTAWDDVDLGGNFGIGDDGPLVKVSATGAEPGAAYLFDGNTTALGNVEGDNGTALPGSDIAADQDPSSIDVEFDAAFDVTLSVGADGGSVTAQYSLVLGVAVGSQVLFSGAGAASGGVDVVWSEVTPGSVYAGMAGGSEVFRLAVDGDGTVTFQKSGVLDHGVDDAGPFSTDALLLDDGQISVRKTVTGADSEGDIATAWDDIDLGGNFGIGDDGPRVEFGNLVGTGTDETQIGYWSGSTGADQPGVLDIDASPTFQIRRGVDGSIDTGTVSFSFDTTTGIGTGTLTGDFDNNPETADTSVGFTLAVNSGGTYAFNLTEPILPPVTYDTNEGELAPGGPDAVQTLSFPDNDNPKTSVVFFGVDLAMSPTPADIQDAIIAGSEDYDEAALEAFAGVLGPGEAGDGTFSWINENLEPNVSKSGIGGNNNQFQGDDQGGVSTDESFVVNPEDLLSRMTVNIDKASDYEPLADEMTYIVYYWDGVTATHSGELPVEAILQTDQETGEQFFDILSDGDKQIDAVQFIMHDGVVRIDSIEFETGTEISADDLLIDFTTVLGDFEGDTASAAFSVDLSGRDISSEFDITLVDAGDPNRDAFNFDVSDKDASAYLVKGFDTGVDELVLMKALDPGSLALDGSQDLGLGDALLKDTRIEIDDVVIYVEDAQVFVDDISFI